MQISLWQAMLNQENSQVVKILRHGFDISRKQHWAGEKIFMNTA